MLLNSLKKIEYGTSPTDHSPNSQSAGKTPSVSHLCHHTEMPWRAPICTYPGEQPYSLWGHFLHPSPATSQPQQASLLWPGPSITIPSCFRGPWRHSPHLHLSEQEKVSETPEAPLPPAAVGERAPKSSQQARLLWPDHSFTSLSSNRGHSQAQAPTATIGGKTRPAEAPTPPASTG